MTSFNWILLVLTAALFGSSFPMIRFAVADIPPLQLAAARVIVAAPVVVFFLYKSGRRLPPIGRKWAPLFALGALTAAIPYFAIAWGQTHISSSLGGILFATIPLFTVLIAPVFTDDARVSASQGVGLFVAFAGVVFAIGPSNLTSIGAQLTGAVITLVAALSYAGGNIFARTRGDLDPVQMAAGQLTSAIIILVPLTAFTGGALTTVPGWPAIFATLAIGVISTAVPVLLMFTLVKRVGPTRASLLAFFIPVSAVLFGVTFLDETLGRVTILGFGLIIGGAIWSTRQPSKTA
ncbi:DMT family transporter [Yoonia sp. R2331]|uniref:DMT family transporter n=1 Tax=Yoonia sp. R2331 TaxID=3237238 RepID=UPI0034E42F94